MTEAGSLRPHAFNPKATNVCIYLINPWSASINLHNDANNSHGVDAKQLSTYFRLKRFTPIELRRRNSTRGVREIFQCDKAKHCHRPTLTQTTNVKIHTHT